MDSTCTYHVKANYQLQMLVGEQKADQINSRMCAGWNLAIYHIRVFQGGPVLETKTVEQRHSQSGQFLSPHQWKDVSQELAEQPLRRKYPQKVTADSYDTFM